MKKLYEEILADYADFLNYNPTLAQHKTYMISVLKVQLDEIVKIIEKTIEEERFSGAPYALNKLIDKLKDCL